MCVYLPNIDVGSVLEIGIAEGDWFFLFFLLQCYFYIVWGGYVYFVDGCHRFVSFKYFIVAKMTL